MADQATFTDDTDPYRRSLYHTARRLTASQAEAEDLVQETYLRAFRSYATFRAGTNLRAWLFRILTNAHINRHRARQRRPAESSLDDLADTITGRLRHDDRYGPSAEDELLAAVSDSEVVAAVAGLSPVYRDAVLLADVEGLSYAEIAARLDIPIGTVMSRLHRGRKSLRSSLATYGAERGLTDRREECLVG
jgi:RNA polymerase sigma-70 factor (ECF subfamily)